MGRRASTRRRGRLHLAHPAEGIALGVAGVLVAATLVAALNGGAPTRERADDVSASSAQATATSAGSSVQGDRLEAVAASMPPVSDPSAIASVGRGVLRLAPTATASATSSSASPASSSAKATATAPATASPSTTPSRPAGATPTSTPSPTTSTPTPSDSATATSSTVEPTSTPVPSSASSAPSDDVAAVGTRSTTVTTTTVDGVTDVSTSVAGN